MSLAPVHRLKKTEIIWLANHKCKHAHTYLEHYNCYLKEKPDQERLGFLDIEATNLKADFGIILCYCIKEANSKKIWQGVITKKDLRTGLDKRVVEKCIKDLSRFDKIVTHYGSRFDFPYIRSRAMYWNIPFPAYGTLTQFDTYYPCRSKLCLHSNRLENVEKFITGKSRKTSIDQEHWIRALQGRKKSLDYILDHCQRDVKILEDVYYKLVDFTARRDSSI